MIFDYYFMFFYCHRPFDKYSTQIYKKLYFYVFEVSYNSGGVQNSTLQFGKNDAVNDEAQGLRIRVGVNIPNLLKFGLGQLGC